MSNTFDPLKIGSPIWIADRTSQLPPNYLNKYQSVGPIGSTQGGGLGTGAFTPSPKTLRESSLSAAREIVGSMKKVICIGIVKDGRYNLRVGAAVFRLSVTTDRESNMWIITLSDVEGGQVVHRAVDLTELVGTSMADVVSKVMPEMMTELAVFLTMEEG